MKIDALSLYPVKSCGKLDVAQFRVGRAGPELELKAGVIGDRQWMFVDSEGKFLTQRSHSRMALLQPVIEKEKFYLQIESKKIEIPLQPQFNSREEVSVWGKKIDARSGFADISEAASQFLKLPVQFVFYDELSEREALVKGRGLGVQTRFTDTQPYLVLTVESLKDLNQRLSSPISADRFRGNILLSGAEKAFAEDDWSQFGNSKAAFESIKACGRCKIITVNPKTGRIPDSEPLKVLAQYRRKDANVFFGQYFLSRSFGELISVGDQFETHTAG